MAVIRLSGPEALPVAESVFRSHARGVSLSGEPARTLHVGWITDGSREIDEVVVALFGGPTVIRVRMWWRYPVMEVSISSNGYWSY